MEGSVDAVRPPHGLMGLRPDSPPWGLLGLSLIILILLILAAYLSVRWWRRHRHSQNASRPLPTVPVVDPWRLLEQRLKALHCAQPWTQESCEEFFFELSFLLRQAVELRTNLPITGQTLAETRLSLEKSSSLSANFQQELLKFLSLAEQLKFAGILLDAQVSQQWQTKVGEWIEQFHHGALT